MEPTSKQIRDAVDQVFTDIGRDRRTVKAYIISKAAYYLISSSITKPIGERALMRTYDAIARRVEQYLVRSNKRGGKIQTLPGKNGGTFLRYEVKR